MKKKIGIIGCGAIGTGLARKINEELPALAQLHMLYNNTMEKATILSQELGGTPQVASTMGELIANCDLVIEAASGSIAFEVAKKGLEADKDVIILSLGGLLGHAKELYDLGEQSMGKLMLPSGALAGLDALTAVRNEGLRKVKLTTTKHPRSLAGAPYFDAYQIDLNSIEKCTVIFRGGPKAAAQGFPKNINVGALLSLAAGDDSKVEIVIQADPNIKRNQHVVKADGDFGTIICTTQNVPSPTNPKTSFLTILTAFELVRKQFSSIQIGT